MSNMAAKRDCAKARSLSFTLGVKVAYPVQINLDSRFAECRLGKAPHLEEN
jgi:hypothetical protein